MEDYFECEMNKWDQFSSCAVPEQGWNIEVSVSESASVESKALAQTQEWLQQEFELKQAELLQVGDYVTVTAITEKLLADSDSDDPWEKSRYLGVSRSAFLNGDSIVRR
jgi:hypothetical protein